MRRAFPLLLGALMLALPAGASASASAPFGHPCTPQNGVRFCPTRNDAERVKTFDGVPLDVDVTLPRTGRGPFPTIVMLHGFPGSKESFESAAPEGDPANTQTYHYNNVFFARQGYAVVNYSARGFGRSCGVPDSRTSPGCDRGWFHFADQRFEVRDAQLLLGKLVDQGVANANELAATGTSYGGGQSMELAFLRDRVRMRDGELERWRSPRGRLLRIAAAWPRWGWSDFVYAAVPNGNFLDFDVDSPWESVSPIGVPKKSVIDALYLGGTVVGYLAPRGADPTADLATWHDRLLAGEPYGRAARAIANQFLVYKSAVALDGTPAPLLVMNGWTDPIFPVEQAVRPYNLLRERDDDAAISLQVGDVGHFRAGNPLATYKVFNADGKAFFDHYLRQRRGGPRPGSVTAFAQACPKGTQGRGPIVVPSWSRLARHRIVVGLPGARVLTAHDGDTASSEFFNPVTNGDPCSTTTGSGGSAVPQGFMLAGSTTVSATIENSRRYGQIDARLFDLFGGRERLIDTGVYRLTPDQDGRIAFQLFGNMYRFAPGHRLRLELRGRNEPFFLADDRFRVRISNVRVEIPTR